MYSIVQKIYAIQTSEYIEYFVKKCYYIKE